MTQNTISTKAWMKDGILYNEYVGALGAKEGVEMASQVKKILLKLKREKRTDLPIIIIFKDIGKTNFLIKPSEVSKILTEIDFANTVSEVWFVGVPDVLQNIVKIMSSPFLRTTPHFSDSVEEAQNELANK